RHEVGTHQQKNDFCRSEPLLDLYLPNLTGTDLTIIPIRNYALSSQITEVRDQPLTEFPIFMCVGDEDIDRGSWFRHRTPTKVRRAWVLLSITGLLLSARAIRAYFIVPVNSKPLGSGRLNVWLAVH